MKRGIIILLMILILPAIVIAAPPSFHIFSGTISCADDSLVSSGNLVVKWYNETDEFTQTVSISNGLYTVLIDADDTFDVDFSAGGELLGTYDYVPYGISEGIDFTLGADNSVCAEDDDDPPTSCFVKGTMVLMADGSQKRIEEIKVGDYVLGGKYNKAEVLELESPIREGYYIIDLIDGTQLKVTNEHPIYARNSKCVGWASIEPRITYIDAKMSVSYLKDMNELYTKTGWVSIESIKYVEGTVQTYNLKNVVGNTFFAEGILVHNKGTTSSSDDCGDGGIDSGEDCDG
ncbi:hypothetical protein K8R33_00670, partial [archaeon]|nr:hypothetical protein [archaeon]